MTTFVHVEFDDGTIYDGAAAGGIALIDRRYRRLLARAIGLAIRANLFWLGLKVSIPVLWLAAVAADRRIETALMLEDLVERKITPIKRGMDATTTELTALMEMRSLLQAADTIGDAFGRKLKNSTRRAGSARRRNTGS